MVVWQAETPAPQGRPAFDRWRGRQAPATGLESGLVTAPFHQKRGSRLGRGQGQQPGAAVGRQAAPGDGRPVARQPTGFEVDEAARGRGLGRTLVSAALEVVPAGEPVFVQVAPGNVPSVRAVLATGRFRPIGGELLFAVGEPHEAAP